MGGLKLRAIFTSPAEILLVEASGREPRQGACDRILWPLANQIPQRVRPYALHMEKIDCSVVEIQEFMHIACRRCLSTAVGECSLTLEGSKPCSGVVCQHTLAIGD